MNAPLLTPPVGVPLTGGIVPLATFQRTAVNGLQGAIRKVVDYHIAKPQHRREIALRSGVMLLQSPTGSGKTLILGRTIEGIRGDLPAKCIWFWFAPYSGLVAQTRDALADQCKGLRLRDIYTDREITGSRDGDVFVQTWAAVSARNKEARKVRRKGGELTLSLDDMIAGLRAEGFLIGVVIDEAHLNFGASASAAADFYLRYLQPDLTLLATATPNDDKLAAFEESAGIEVANRIVIDRGQVVDARLNKAGLMLGVIRFQPEDAELIDMEQATLTAAWSQHSAIRERLRGQGIGITPLMLVQVEDQAAGEEDPVARVREKLEQIGVPVEAIKSHTSGEPDPEFHSFAYDPTVEVLIFKVAVATGFDAPRAWTLVSVRPNRGRDFGLQIVGRIMRVHPLVRAQREIDAFLDRGYVFLTDPELQAGLNAAVQELRAIRHGIELITDHLDVVEFGNTQAALDAGVIHIVPGVAAASPRTPEERQQRLALLIDAGFVPLAVSSLAAPEQDRAIIHGEALVALTETPLFGNLPQQQAPTAGATAPRRKVHYPLRADLPNFPKALIREEVPEIHQISADLTETIAKEFTQSVDLKGELNRRFRNATLSLRDLFLEGIEENKSLKVRISNARIAQHAQLAFKFNDSVDPRLLKQALVREFQRICDEDGIDYKIEDLRRAIDLAVMKQPDGLRLAMQAALRRHLRFPEDEPIPSFEYGDEGLPAAQKAAYGVFPEHMNGEERAFAEFLDADRTGTVLWWLRNQENTRWATRLVLPNGKRFFPDFVVGVANRSTPNAIALVEVKDDGVTGRLQSDNNIMKIRVQHNRYQNVFWSYRESGSWIRAAYADGLHRIVPRDRFRIEEMVYLN